MSKEQKSLIVENLSLKYDDNVVLNDINFEIGDSEILALVGPSGSGKTSLIRCITGLHDPNAAIIKISENIIFSTKENVPIEKRDIGIVFQDFALFPHLNVKQNIEFAGKRNIYLFNKLIKKLSIKDHISKYPHELSGGQQQRVSIARALFSDPKILLIDEPISNQDQDNKVEIIEILSEFIKEKEVICILVSHVEINNNSQVKTRSYTLS